MQYRSKSNKESHERDQAIDIWQWRVIVRVKLPITDPIDIIIPTAEANFRAYVLWWETKFRRALSTFSMRLLVILIVPVSPFQFNPNQVRDWVGYQTHFSSLTNMPALDRSELIKPELLVQVCIIISFDVKPIV